MAKNNNIMDNVQAMCPRSPGDEEDISDLDRMNHGLVTHLSVTYNNSLQLEKDACWVEVTQTFPDMSHYLSEVCAKGTVGVLG